MNNSSNICIVCRSFIDENATKCNFCNSHQKVWKNLLIYYAKISVLLSITIAITSHTVNLGLNLYKNFTWKDEVKVLDLVSTKGITVANNGDGDVFIQHLHLYSKQSIELNSINSEIKFDGNKGINSILEKNKIKRFEFDENLMNPYLIAKYENDSQLNNLLNRAFKSADKCVKRFILLKNGSSHNLYKKNYGDKLIVFDVDVELIFFSIKRDEIIRESIPAVGIIGVSTLDECSIVKK